MQGDRNCSRWNAWMGRLLRDQFGISIMTTAPACTIAGFNDPAVTFDYRFDDSES